jgi:NADPH:quinone reductase-like Zn-dependent oxidoreductase
MVLRRCSSLTERRRDLPSQIKFSEFGDPEVLTFVEAEAGEPGPDEVLIRIRAIGLNRAEAMFRRNEYIFAPTLPAVLGSEAAGTVIAVGQNVTHVSAGDDVNIVPGFPLGDYGIYGEIAIAPARAVIAKLPTLSFEEAASIWTMFLTAYGPLVEEAKIQAGEHVLISAASSSTGLAAIQLANLVGAIPIALTRTNAKRQRLLDAGAAHVVAYEEDDMVAEVMRITDGRGATVAFDPVGGSLLPRLLKVMPWKGTIYLYGALGGDTMTIPVLEHLGQMATIRGWIVADLLADLPRMKAAVAYVQEALEAGKIRPVVDTVFEFDQMVEAHRYLESAQQFGKIVVTVADSSAS